MPTYFARLTLLIAVLGVVGCRSESTEEPLIAKTRAAAVMPTISSFSPLTGPAGTPVTINGTGFTGATDVTFASSPSSGPAAGPLGAPAVFTVVNDTKITAQVPSGTVTGPIFVNTPAGTAVSAESFVVQSSAVPTITGFDPPMAGEGSFISIHGSGFTGTTSVEFNGLPVTYFYLAGDGDLGTWVPRGASSGPITVTNTLGSATSANFAVLPPPVITAIAPSSGKPGDAVKITGTGFTGAVDVCFGGGDRKEPQPVPSTGCSTFVIDSDTQITVTVPSGAQSGYITVIGSGASAQSPTPFTVLSSALPQIQSFSPPGGGIDTRVNVMGTGFTGTTAVKFNGLVASFYLVSDLELWAYVPPGATTGPISVTNTLGTATSGSNFNIIPRPTITGVLPDSGKPGDTFVITGTGFTGATAVCIGEEKPGQASPPLPAPGGPDAGPPPPPSGPTGCATFTVDSATQITATVPLGATSGPVFVTTPGGGAVSPMVFVVLSSAPPTISGFSPTTGGAHMDVVIDGTHFTGTTGVTFNGLAASFFVMNDSMIRTFVPTGATTGPIAVTNTLGTATSTTDFVVIPPPSITGFSPGSAKPGDTITVDGSGFAGAYSVCLGYSGDGRDPKPSGTGGAGGCPAFSVVSDTQLTFTVPSGVSSGPILVSGPGGTGQSLSNLTILSSAPPVISSFSPTTGGVNSSVVISGSNFTGTVAVTFNGLNASFTVSNDNQIYTWAPPGVTTGPITVVNTEGSDTSATNFNVLPPPTVSGFSPGSGVPGDAVVITGTNLSQVSRVSFNDRGAEFRVVSNTQILAYVPPGASTGPIDVGGTKTATDFVVLSDGPPMINGFSPTQGSPGSFTIIYGGNFTGATEVLFNGKPAASFGLESDSSMYAYVPQGATTGPITVTNSVGSATSTGNFTVVSPPSITSFSPSTGKVGDTVVITGTGFNGVTSVRFGGGVQANFTVDSDTQITTAVPAGAITGPIELNQSVSSPGVFTVVATDPPTVSGFTPTTGSVGTNVTVSGTGFNGVTGVTVGGVAAFSFNVRSDNVLDVRVPPNAVTGPIAVTNSLGTGASSTSFIVIPPPSITSFSPTSQTAGKSVTITGTGFTGTKEVSFNGTSASVFSVVNDTTLTAVVPLGATSGPIRVSTPGGEALSTQSFTVLSSTTPKITGFAPTSGGVGANVVISGSGFTGTTAVAFNGVAAQFSVTGDGRIDVSVPPGATTGPISVTNSLGTSTTTASFTVIPAPTLSGFSPASGKVGDTVTLTGTNLQGATSVNVGGSSAASFVVVNGSTVTAVVGAGAVSGPVSIATPGGTATASGTFKLLSLAAPTISGFGPTSGGPGTTVKITGTGFAGATGVAFNGSSTTSFVVEDDGNLAVIVPTGATSGPISVTNNVGTGTSQGSFTVLPPPSITSFSPATGTAGDSVVITGSNFTGATEVAFGLYGKAPAAFTVDSATQITATVPAGATNGPIQVVTGGGTAVSSSSFTVTSSAPPTITTFMPASGGPTTLVIIQGTGFTGVTGVSFNGIPSSLFVTDKGDTFVVASVPPGATTGPITVTNTLGSATSSTDFVINPNQGLTITSVSPSSGTPGTLVTITGTNLQGAEVMFFDEQNAPVLSGTNTSLTVVVPAGAKTGPLIVVRNFSSGGFIGAIWDLFTVYASSCAGQAPGTPCGLCSACDGAGACAAALADDSGCGRIDCGALDTTCRDYQDVTTNRCASKGVCKAAPAACAAHVDRTGACDDGDACTAGESCQAGVCGAPASVVTCSPSDTCHTAACNPTTGLCANAPKADGAGCDDQNACTTGESCTSGVCGSPASTVTCAALDSCHDVGVCNPATGQCSNPAKADGATCDDGSACTAGETCTAGVCASPSSIVVCSALDACHTVGICNPLTGSCSNPAASDGTTCDDNRACTTGESCQAGVCVPPSAVNCPCTTDTDCFALDQCHDVGTCDVATSRCSTPPKSDGTACNDANGCTIGEACHSGVCGAAPQQVVCTPPECQVGLCDTATGACANTAAQDGTPCSGGLCASGACTAIPDGGRSDAGSGGAGGGQGGPDAGTPSGGTDAGTASGGTGVGGAGATSGGASGSSGAGGTAGTGAVSNTGTGGGAVLADAGTDASSAAAAAQDEGGCGCRVGASDRRANSAALALSLATLAAARRRSKRRAQRAGSCPRGPA